MDDFIKSIKNKLSVENLVEHLKEEYLSDEQKEIPVPLAKVEPAQNANVEDLATKMKEEQPVPSTQQSINDLQKNVQKKEPATKTSLNVLQKPVESEEVRDPFRDDENLFNFYD